jgi:hypothetical protein
MTIEYVDLVKQVRDLVSNGVKLGFSMLEGYVIERIDDGMVLRITHPDAKGRERLVPITNVASWGVTEGAQAKRTAARVAEGVR